MKKVEKYINFSVYRYAPESFNLTFNGKKVPLTYNEKSTFGNILITKGEKELLKEVKRFFRKHIFNQNLKMVTLSIPLQNHNEYVHLQNSKVNRYDIKDKLTEYKILKTVLKDNNYAHPFKMEKATLNYNMQVQQVEELENKMILSKRIKLIA